MINHIVALGLCAATASSQKVEESFESGEEAAFPWIHNRTCPDPEVRFYLFTRSNPDKQQLIHVDATSEASNLSSSFFNPGRSSVIIVHGFRSDMFLTPLFEMKNGENCCLFSFRFKPWMSHCLIQNIFSWIPTTFSLWIGTIYRRAFSILPSSIESPTWELVQLSSWDVFAIRALQTFMSSDSPSAHK